MNVWTPTTDEIRDWYARRTSAGTVHHAPLAIRRAEFVRWLAAHDEQVRAEERERIARAIEDDCEADEPPCYGCWNAARIARQGGTQ